MNYNKCNFWVNVIFCIATCFIAIYAFKSFNASFATSKKVTNSLKSMEEGLNELRPLVIDVNWLGLTLEVGCESPPTGLQVVFGNLSRISIRVHGQPKLSIYLGDTKIDVPISFLPSFKEGRKIFAPGKFLVAEAEDKGTFKKYLGIEKPDIRLPLNFVFEVKFSRINDDKMFRYYTKQVIHFDCSNLTPFLDIEVIDEYIEPIDEPTS